MGLLKASKLAWTAMSGTTRLVVSLVAIGVMGSVGSQIVTTIEESKASSDRAAAEAEAKLQESAKLEAERARIAAMTPAELAAEKAKKEQIEKDRAAAAARAKVAEEARVAEAKRQAEEAEAKRSEWEYEDDTDQVTGKRVSHAVLRSQNLQHLSFPYGGGTRGTLHIRRHPRWGLDVIFMTSNGQIQCQEYADCRVYVRLDDKPPITLRGNPSGDNDPTVVFLNSSLVDKIRKSSRAIVSVTMYQEGERTFEFRTKNLHWK